MESTYSRWMDIRDEFLDDHKDTIMIAKFLGMKPHPIEFDVMVYDDDVIHIRDLDFSTYANLMPIVETLKAIFPETALEKLNQVWREDLCEQKLYREVINFINKHNLVS